MLAAALGGCAAVPHIDTRHRSVNQESRVRYLILHFTWEDFPTSLQELTRGQVSSHYLVDAAPPRIYRLVDEDRRAWHAGVSEFLGRSACNDFSIGLELEGTDDAPYPGIQMQAAADVLAGACIALPHLKWIAGHCDLAPGRKTDPGPAFSWPEMLRLLDGRGCLLTRPYP